MARSSRRGEQNLQPCAALRAALHGGEVSRRTGSSDATQDIIFEAVGRHTAADVTSLAMNVGGGNFRSGSRFYVLARE